MQETLVLTSQQTKKYPQTFLADAQRQVSELHHAILEPENTIDRWYALTNLAYAYVDLRVDTRAVIQTLYTHINTVSDALHKPHHYAQLAQVLAYGGNVVEARRAMSQAEVHGNDFDVRAYLAVAQASARMQLDPVPFITKAYRIAGNMRMGTQDTDQNYKAYTRTDEAQRIEHLIQIADMYATVGFSPSSLLGEAAQLLEHPQGGPYSSNSKNRLYGKLIEVYVKHGHFDTAKITANAHIEDSQSNDADYSEKHHAFYTVAHEQIKRGNYTDALETATDSGSNQVVASIAAESAARGYRQRKLIELAQEKMHQVQNTVHHEDTYRHLYIYGLIGKAQALAEMEPTELTYAFQQATKIDDFQSKVAAYIMLGQLISEAGFDPSQVYTSALKRVEKLRAFAKGDYDPTVIQMMLEEVAESAAEVGAFDIAERAIGAMDTETAFDRNEVYVEQIKLLRAKATVSTRAKSFT